MPGKIRSMPGHEHGELFRPVAPMPAARFWRLLALPQRVPAFTVEGVEVLCLDDIA